MPAINNDHVVSPDGTTVYVSADDGHLYAVPLDGRRAAAGDQRPRTGFHHYLHGVSPDGQHAGVHRAGARSTVAGSPTCGRSRPPAGPTSRSPTTSTRTTGRSTARTGSGSTSTPSGRRPRRGMRSCSGSRSAAATVEQLTFDERVNWFPHPAPDGSAIAYVSFPPGTLGIRRTWTTYACGCSTPTARSGSSRRCSAARAR